MEILLGILIILIALNLFLKPKAAKHKVKQSAASTYNKQTVEEVTKDGQEESLNTNDQTTTSKEYNIQEFAGRYQKRLLLTKNEYYEYKKLRDIASRKGLQICPKIRLLDLIEPRRGDPKYKTLFYKIQAKHVDFVICDQNLYVKAILELDDNSHNQTDRQERDHFVDLILRDVGYTVIRTKSITDDILDNITT